MLSLNGIELSFGEYPNGESLVPSYPINPNRPDPKRLGRWIGAETNKIVMKWESDQDLIHLYFLQSYIQHRGGYSRLEIPYFPYSRMDRDEAGGKNCSLRYVTNLINSLSFVRVTVWDPHSKKTLDWLNDSEAVYPAPKMILPMARAVGFNPLTDYLILPDKGAKERYGDFGLFNVATMTKKRNFDTGQIESIELDEEIPVLVHGGSRVKRQAIIVDDLSSYGGTFIHAAQLLFAAGFDKVHLLVTHLEEAAFKGELLDTIDTVWASDSMQVPWSVDAWYKTHRKGTPKVRIYEKEEWA